MAENRLEQVIMSIVDNINDGWEMDLTKWELAEKKKMVSKMVDCGFGYGMESYDTVFLRGFPDLAFSRVGLYKMITYRVAVPWDGEEKYFPDEHYRFAPINIPGFWRRIKFSRKINKIINQVIEQKRIAEDNVLADKIMEKVERQF